MKVCHTLRGCVDWNVETMGEVERHGGHTLRGCVDWNLANQSAFSVYHQSHPSWVCGLKLFARLNKSTFAASHPSWVCGLKPVVLWHTLCPNMSHPSWVCGLKLISVNEKAKWLCHTLRGCVDWNLQKTEPLYVIPVTPFVGVWIETSVVTLSTFAGIVTPFVGVWIETRYWLYYS